jgi:iron complex transport system substrate-binding protein
VTCTPPRSAARAAHGSPDRSSGTSGRHRLATLVVLVTAVVVLLAGACGSVAEEGGSAPPTGTRTVTDALGRSVEVPAQAARVVTLSEPSLDASLALGVVPVGASSGRGQAAVPNYLAERAEGVPIVASLSVPNFEQITSVQPDLIVVDGTSINDDLVIDQLQAIAPTVFTGVSTDEWQTLLRNAADAMGRADEAERAIGGYETRVEQVREGLGDNADAAVSIVRWGLTSGTVILQELPPSKVIADLGLRRPPSQDREGAGHSEPVSLENMADLDADWMFFGTLGGAGGGGTATFDEGGGDLGVQASADELERVTQRVAGFAQLRAVASGRAVPVDGSAWTSAGGILAALTILDDVDRAMGSGTA